MDHETVLKPTRQMIVLNIQKISDFLLVCFSLTERMTKEYKTILIATSFLGDWRISFTVKIVSKL